MVDSLPPTEVTRRTVLANVAWTVPAVAMAAAVPAYAASNASNTVTVASTNMRVLAAGSTTVTATVTDSSGTPLAGQPVSFTGPSGTSFAPAVPPTDGSGVATTSLSTTDAWATPGSTVLVTATSSGATGSAPLTVLGANAYGVGANIGGELGTPATASTLSTPTQLSYVFPSPIRSIASSNGWTLALLQDGTVWGIGLNATGQLGDGTTTNRFTWTKIPTLTGVVQLAIAVRSSTCFALLSDGTVRAWGGNANGQLGNGTTVNSSTPVTVQNLTGVTSIAAGAEFALAVVSGGEVRAWGRNTYGEIPNGTTSTSIPVPVAGISGASHVSAISYTAYAIVGGQVYAWGYGRGGEIGNGLSADSRPTLVSGLTGVTQMAGGWGTAYAVMGGQVKAWGSGAYGTLGNGGTASSNVPVTVSGLTGITRIGAMTYTAYALSASGAFAWGSNAYGQLGDGTTTDRFTPGPVTGIANVTDLSVNAVNSYSAFFLR